MLANNLHNTEKHAGGKRSGEECKQSGTEEKERRPGRSGRAMWIGGDGGLAAADQTWNGIA
jgi:hypothetical protein